MVSRTHTAARPPLPTLPTLPTSNTIPQPYSKMQEDVPFIPIPGTALAARAAEQAAARAAAEATAASTQKKGGKQQQQQKGLSPLAPAKPQAKPGPDVQMVGAIISTHRLC